MNKNKQKDLLKYKLDYQPEDWKAKHTVRLVVVISLVLGALFVTAECLINFGGC